jgi:DNA replication protein
MKGFSGFPEGKQRLTPIPNLFFSELLPMIDDLGELRMTLYAFWALYQKEGRFQYIREDEILSDRLLKTGFQPQGRTPEDAMREALERTVLRGTLLKVSLTFSDRKEDLYFLNSPKGRAAVRAIEDGQWTPTGDEQAPVELAVERPNIYTLYEHNIGPLTPMIAEKLRAAEADFPPAWIEEAMRIAVENNVRKWRYVEAILEDWQRNGRDERSFRNDTDKARRRYIEGEYADFFHDE